MAKNVPLVGNGGGQGSAGASEGEESEMELEVVIKAKIELTEGDEGQETNTRGEEKTYYLAWEHEDLKHPSNRYRDMPEEQDRDWAGLVNNVLGGMALTIGAAALAYAAPYALAGTKIGTVIFKGASAAQAGKSLGMAAFLAGSMNTIGLGVSDFLSNRVSSREEYMRRALAGSISGVLSGATTLALADAGLAAVMGGGFAEGFASELITQKLLNEDGSVDWGQCVASGIFTAVMDGVIHNNIEGSTHTKTKSQREMYPHWYNENGVYTGGRTQEALDALAFDPHKGKITKDSILEREIILALEEQHYVEHVIRDTWGRGDFYDDIMLKLYDIKSFKSFPLDNMGNPITSINGGAFDVNRAIKNIMKEFNANGVDFVIIYTRDMTPLHVMQLKQRIDLEGLSNMVIWF